MSEARRPRRQTLAWCALALSASVVYWTWSGDQTRHVDRHLLVWALAAGAYLVALRAARGIAPHELNLALGLSLCWRLALVTAPPLLSDDLYRSVWEGRIQLHGGNPYAWADRPESERWRPLRDRSWELMNHRGYTAAYPPAWQLAMRAVVALRDSPAAVKLFLVGCEALALLALTGVCTRRGLGPERVLIWAWSPLALVEIAGSGHNEPLGLLFVVLALGSLGRGRPAAAALWLALGAQSKLVPALFAAGWVRRFRIWHVLLAGLAAAMLVWPFAGAGVGLWRSLVALGRFWRFNETVFAALAALLGSHDAASLAAHGLLAVLAAALAWRRVEPGAAGLALASAWLLLSANVLPWYALWLLPWLVLREAPWALAFTLTSGLAYLVYPHYLAGGAWQVPAWARVCEYGPPLLLAAAPSLRRFAGRGGAPA